MPFVVAKVNDPVRANAYTAMGIAVICRTSMMVESLAEFAGLPHDPGAMRVMAPTGRHAHPDHGTGTEGQA